MNNTNLKITDIKLGKNQVYQKKFISLHQTDQQGVITAKPKKEEANQDIKLGSEPDSSESPER